jgi:polar amino acid transport system substrate-binding protein
MASSLPRFRLLRFSLAAPRTTVPLLAALLLGTAPTVGWGETPGPRLEAAAAAPVLRVGALEGSPPCSQQQGQGRWKGHAVELWRDVASREKLPYVFLPFPSPLALLEATRSGAVDVGVGCLSITPERVGPYRFSLPFQESGLALLVRSNRLAAGQAVLRQLLRPQLLVILGAYLLAIGLVALLVWRLEGAPPVPSGRRQRWRQFATIFQVLATGPGTNSLVSRVRGHALVVLSYLIRIVGASLLVSTITLDVLQQPPALDDLPRSLEDLAGRRVGARPGSASERLLRTPPLAGRVQVVPLPRLEAAAPLLLERQVDAVLADEQQLQYVRERLPAWQRNQLRLVLDGDRPESQAFAFSPQLDAATADRIDRAISQVKRDGLLP